MSYSHYDVAHRWANGIGESCRGNNMFFEGDSIYSYGHHFVIARKYKGIVLFNEETYSSSTAKHKSYVRSACWQNLVPVPVLEHNSDPASDSFFVANIKAWREQVEHIITGPLQKARKPEKYYLEIDKIIKKAERLCEVLDRALPGELKMYKTKGVEREALIQKAVEQEKKRKAAEERKRREAEKENIEKFMAFKTNYFNGLYQIVRLNKDKNRFETSLGVECPFEKGREFYDKLVANQLKVGDRLLFYTVREVGKLVRVGCHTFERSYLLKYGKEVFA